MDVDPGTVKLLRAAGCVYAEDEARVLTDAAGTDEQLRAMIDRRAAGEPLELIVGWGEFYGLRVPLCAGVFVPRRRSEFLVDCTLDAVAATGGRVAGARRVKLLDLCCGSGAIGLAVARNHSNVDLLSADSSPDATTCATVNLAGVGGRVFTGDLYAALPASERGRIDVIVANAPYVPSAEVERMPAEARLFEPRPTLDGGPTGTAIQKRILSGAAPWLTAWGSVLIETGERMADETVSLARAAGLHPQILRSEALQATVVLARRNT